MARLEIPVQLRWSDMDAYQHVNNAEMLRLLEEARIDAFWNADLTGGRWPTAIVDAGPGATTFTLVARQEIEYLRPLAYQRAPVTIVLWLGHLGGASMDLCYEVRDRPAGDEGSLIYARAVTTMVLVDVTTNAPRRISADERAAWEPYLEDPLVLRRRPGA